MTKLGCSVSSCIHYSDNLCCKQKIIVDGTSAKNSQDTCCGSFNENKDGTFKNIFKTPENRLEVDCEAVQCVYNDSRHCNADRIDISGDGAKRPEHTECATFKAR